ncbi:MAG: F0F1 ATP synthase subunit delta [Anaerolineae bacterium]|jgi:F-type H+-transporting ATPase subunit b|nr:hypothetical protein [Chloroflexota bacterium]
MLDLDWRTILWQCVNFAAIVLILNWLVFRPLRAKLAERRQSISESLQAAEEQEAEAERLKAHWEERRAHAEADAENIIRAAEAQADARAAQILRDTRAHVDRLTEELRIDLQHERDEIISQHYEDLLDGVMALSANVVRSVTTRRTHDDLVANSVAAILRTPIAQVEAYRSAMAGRVPTAFVTTPVALSRDQAKSLAEALSSLLDRHVEVREAIDPGIIAGIQVRIADQLMENSIRQQLVQVRDAVMADLVQRQGATAT